jgi:hypothetical protein
LLCDFQTTAASGIRIRKLRYSVTRPSPIDVPRTELLPERDRHHPGVTGGTDRARSPGPLAPSRVLFSGSDTE